MDKFREKLPAFKGKKIIIIPLIALCSFLFTYYFTKKFISLAIFLDSLSLEALAIISPIIGIIMLETIAFFCVYQMWLKKDTLKMKYGQKSYQRIFPIGFFGISIVIGLSFYNIAHLSNYNDLFWQTYPYRIFSQALSKLSGLDLQILNIIRVIMGIFIILLGFLMIIRSLITFGIDYMTVVYLYFPEESEVKNHKIYSILRHPTYAGLIYMSIGGTLIQFSLYAIIAAIFYVIYFWIHIRKVEEKELIQRFGESYNEYRKKTPALFAHFSDWFVFLKILFGLN